MPSRTTYSVGEWDDGETPASLRAALGWVAKRVPPEGAISSSHYRDQMKKLGYEISDNMAYRHLKRMVSDGTMKEWPERWQGKYWFYATEYPASGEALLPAPRQPKAAKAAGQGKAVGKTKMSKARK